MPVHPDHVRAVIGKHDKLPRTHVPGRKLRERSGNVFLDGLGTKGIDIDGCGPRVAKVGYEGINLSRAECGGGYGIGNHIGIGTAGTCDGEAAVLPFTGYCALETAARIVQR